MKEAQLPLCENPHIYLESFAIGYLRASSFLYPLPPLFPTTRPPVGQQAISPQYLSQFCLSYIYYLMSFRPPSLRRMILALPCSPEPSCSSPVHSVQHVTRYGRCSHPSPQQCSILHEPLPQTLAVFSPIQNTYYCVSAALCHLCLLSIYLSATPPRQGIITPNWRKQGLREVKPLALGHIAGQWKSQDSNPSLASSKAKLFPLLLHSTSLKSRASPSWISCFSAPPTDGALFSLPDTYPIITLDCLLLFLCEPLWSTPAIVTGLPVHTPHTSSPTNHPQALLKLLKSKQVSAPRLSYDSTCMISLC